ncbi:hypothetical protein L209DRAFT_691292 [Thermothelomyces heterothallicus CBS 203.75]
MPGPFWNEEQPGSIAFHGLLLSCSRIYKEAAALLYSANEFVLHYETPGSLQPLLALTPPVLSALASLKIVLTQTACHHPAEKTWVYLDCCVRGYSKLHCRRFHIGIHQLPLPHSPPGADNDDPSAAATDLLSEWHAAASHLSSHITPGRLELGLVCDIDPQHQDAIDLANRALEPLRHLPLLRDCHIRLCETPNPRLSRLARDVVMQSCGITLPYLEPVPGKTTFLSLPRELRLRILEYTDLVTPTKEVWWCRKDFGYSWSGNQGRLACVGPWRWECSYNSISECWFRRKTHVVTMSERSIGCFCRRRHAAISTTCTCWAPPGPALFLVSRAWCRDAQLVFFSANRFVVHDLDIAYPQSTEDPGAYPHWKGEILDGDYPFKRFAASHFLREVIPPRCIAYLRFLELVFPFYRHGTWPQTDHPAMEDWRDTVAWLRDKINGPALTTRLFVTEQDEIRPPGLPHTVAERDKVYRAYMSILQPLRQLTEGANGLAGFYTNLHVYPQRWIENVSGTRAGKMWEREHKALKEKAERYVMGDRYDSLYANGREEPKLSVWRHVDRFHFEFDPRMEIRSLHTGSNE